MALVIEDGSGIVGANSYSTVAEILAFCSARGVDLSGLSESELEVLAVNAMDYIEARRDRFQGLKTYPGQDLQFPRTGVYIDNELLAEDSIPKELKQAQAQLVIEQQEFDDLSPSNDGYAVALEKVDVLEIEYATGGRLSNSTTPATPTYPKVDAFLNPLLKNSGAFGLLRAKRL